MKFNIGKVRRIKRKIRFFYQKVTRGFDNSDLWSLDHTIIEFIYPRLKAFREMNTGSVPLSHDPTKINDGIPDALSSEEWNAILDEMLLGFKLVAESDLYPLLDEHKIVEKSFNLFHEWFFDLWD